MNVLKPSTTTTPVPEKRITNLLNMDITSTKDKRLLFTQRNKRSDLTIDQDQEILKRNKTSHKENNKILKITKNSKSLAHKQPLKPKQEISIENKKKMKRNNLSTNNHNFKKRLLLVANLSKTLVMKFFI